MTTTTISTPQGQALLDIQTLRALHQKARENLNAKQTELRLVVASRYKELVTSNHSSAGGDSLSTQGTYGELCTMHTHAKQLVAMLEGQGSSDERGMEQLLRDTILRSNLSRTAGNLEVEREEMVSNVKTKNVMSLSRYRYELSSIPQRIHQNLSGSHIAPMIAAQNLVRAFHLIDCQNSTSSSGGKIRFPLAREHTSRFFSNNAILLARNAENDKCLEYQIRIIYEHLGHLPIRILSAAKEVLLQENFEASDYSGALVALVLMDNKLIPSTATGEKLSCRLLDLFLENKASMLMKYLKLGNDEKQLESPEDYLSNLVSIIQNLVLQAYYIFSGIKKDNGSSIKELLSSYSTVEYSLSSIVLKDKVSLFLNSYFPLVTKTSRFVLSNMRRNSGYLGKIREVRYLPRFFKNVSTLPTA